MKIDQASKLITLIDKQVYFFSSSSLYNQAKHFDHSCFLFSLFLPSPTTTLLCNSVYPNSFNFMPHILYSFATFYFHSPCCVYKNCIQSLKHFKFMLQCREYLNSNAIALMEKRVVHVVVQMRTRVSASMYVCVCDCV